MAKLTQKDAEGMIRDAGLRLTDHRLMVLMEVAKSREPITVQVLVDVLRSKEDIDQATIYRNLSSLHEAGLLRRLDFNHGHAHYELETDEPSQQIVCSKCETIEKIAGINLDDIVKKMIKKSDKFKRTRSHTLEIYGICKRCA